MDQHFSGLTKLGFGVLACNTGLAIYNSWDDAASISFVLLVDTRSCSSSSSSCIREFELDGGRGRDAKIRAAVWALTTLLTAMFASRVVPVMPPAVGAVVWVMAVATTADGFWAFFLNP